MALPAFVATAMVKLSVNFFSQQIFCTKEMKVMSKILLSVSFPLDDFQVHGVCQ
jgi:Cft2 family RNA processing exonuclease